MSGGEPSLRAERGTDMERKKKFMCGIRMALFAAWAAVWMTGCTSREDVFLEEAVDEKEDTEAEVPLVTQVPQTIFVDVCGAVANPGVYELDEGSRIFQAVDAAGGYLPEAAQNYLNRASSLMDGQQIYIPTEDEIAENLEALLSKAPEALQGGAVEGAGGGAYPDGSVAEGGGSTSSINLNTADVTQLCTLSGIGQSKAEAIIAYREEHGGFTSIEEIMNVEGIKEGTFSKIKDKISVG